MYSKEFLEQPEVLALRVHTMQPFLDQQVSAAIRNELEKPLPNYPDPPTRVRVLVSNFLHRDHAGSELYVPKVGAIIIMPRTDAHSLAGIGRVEILP